MISMEDFLNTEVPLDMQELHDEIEADLAVRLGNARREVIHDMTELDMVQFILSRDHHA